MRIVGGTLKGRLLKAPPSSEVRPTADRVRQSIFNILESHGITYEDRAVLDVFAGSGALGLEALSRGCPEGTFLDKSDISIKTLLSNVNSLKVDSRVKILKRDVFQISESSQPFGLVFLDPPYEKNLLSPCLFHLKENGWIGKGSWLVMEMGGKEPFSPSPFYDIWQDRLYGTARVVFAEVV